MYQRSITYEDISLCQAHFIISNISAKRFKVETGHIYVDSQNT